MTVSGQGVVRTYDSLKSNLDTANLKYPDRITSVTCRNYIATMTQVTSALILQILMLLKECIIIFEVVLVVFKYEITW